ncbi:alpha/beta fold hydrolase [Dactylosporangium cerinum]
MAGLGYERFAAQGHDWGTSVSTAIAQQDPDRVIGLHLVPPLAAPDPATFDDLTDAERRSLADLERAGQVEDGYSSSSRPARRPSATAWSTPLRRCAPGSWRSSGRGPTGSTARSPTTTCWTT